MVDFTGLRARENAAPVILPVLCAHRNYQRAILKQIYDLAIPNPVIGSPGCLSARLDVVLGVVAGFLVAPALCVWGVRLIRNPFLQGQVHCFLYVAPIAGAVGDAVQDVLFRQVWLVEKRDPSLAFQDQ